MHKRAHFGSEGVGVTHALRPCWRHEPRRQTRRGRLAQSGRAYLDEACAAVTRIGLHVLKRLGDRLMAPFGYPQAQENDAERTCALRFSSWARSLASTRGTRARGLRSRRAHPVVVDTTGDVFAEAFKRRLNQATGKRRPRRAVDRVSRRRSPPPCSTNAASGCQRPVPLATLVNCPAASWVN